MKRVIAGDCEAGSGWPILSWINKVLLILMPLVGQQPAVQHGEALFGLDHRPGRLAFVSGIALHYSEAYVAGE